MLRRALSRAALALIVSVTGLAAATAPAGAVTAPTPRPLIINGVSVSTADFPAMAALVDLRAATARQGTFCGGTLIAPTWVLTAAHCVSPRFVGQADPPLRVLLGRADLSAVGQGELLRVRRVVPHPGFDANSAVNDIAVVELAQPSAATPAPVVTPSTEPAFLTAGGGKATVAGWGALDGRATQFPLLLQAAQIDMFPSGQCSAIWAPIFTSATQLCGTSLLSSVCSGDSGGPLYASDEAGIRRLAGIVSYSSDQGCLGPPAVFTRVAAFTSWITEVTGLALETPLVTPIAPVPSPAPAPGGAGYWMLGRDGRVYPFGSARGFGDAAGQLGADRAVALQPTRSGHGYWIATAAGRVLPFGDAPSFGSVAPGALAPGETVTSMAATPSGAGYYLFSSRGRVLPFGDAVHRGDMVAVPLNGPVLGGVLTPSGLGYYMVGSDGGIFSFGDAVFRGSMGGQRLNAEVRALVPTAAGDGYWLVAADGGVFAFDAPFKGSMGGTRLARPVVGMVRYGDGYLMVASDGGIFNFSSLPFVGSLGDNPPANPVVTVAAVNA